MDGMTVTAEIVSGQLEELVKQVQAGNDVLLMQNNKPIAKLVPASNDHAVPGNALRIRSLKGHKVLTPVFSQAELAVDMFDR